MTASVYLGDCLALAKVQTGHKIYVDTRDEGIAPHILLDGVWEQWITHTMSSFLRNATYIDVGANVGWHCVQASHRGARRVIAYEPNPHICELLKKTGRVNGFRWEVVNKAVGDQEGTLTLQLNEKWPGSATCLEGTSLESWKELQVPVVTLDQHLGVLDKDVVLKVDVEGFEPYVVRGAQRLISGKCTVFLEHHADPVNVRGVKDMLDFFDRLRYRMSLIEHSGNIVQISRTTLEAVPDAEMLLFQRFPE